MMYWKAKLLIQSKNKLNSTDKLKTLISEFHPKSNSAELHELFSNGKMKWDNVKDVTLI